MIRGTPAHRHRATRAASLCAALTSATLACSVVACAESPLDGSATPQLRLVSGMDERDPSSVHLTGLTERALADLAAIDTTSWPRFFAVYTDAAADNPQALPLLGTYTFEDSKVVFTPRFPFNPGVNYRARWTPSGGDATEIEFSVEAPDESDTGRVTGVYPSAPVWPMNQLKMYLHFSTPMRTGVAFDHIRLIDEATDSEVEQPFVTVQEELWDRDHTVLTVLYDPARIKRGLVPHEQAGLPLREGGTYRLVVDPGWPDDAGRALARGFERTFRVGGLDRESPHPSRWAVDAPRPGTRDPLTVDFHEPMDHALLHSLIRVRHAGPDAGASGWRVESASSDQDAVVGTIETDEDESVWRFVPANEWTSGVYEVAVPTILEDLAGNSLRSLFDVDLSDAPSEFYGAEAVYLNVSIRAR